MRIAVCGISVECSTFSSHVTELDDFIIRRGDEALAGIATDEWAPGAEIFGIVVATAGAGGPIRQDAFDSLEAEMLSGLRSAGHIDGVWMQFHGGMSVIGRTGAEERLVRKVREITGPDTVISGSFDTHGNMSRELAGLIDLAAFHRHAPHVDSEVTRERAVKNLVRVVEHGMKPYKAWVEVPILLAGEAAMTSVEPGESVFGAQLEVIQRYGLVDAAICIGFLWADEARNSAAVFTTSWVAQDAAAAASELATEFWRRRAEFHIDDSNSGTWEEALAHVRARRTKPLYISDSGDNVTAGASGDITYALSRTLSNRELVASGAQILFAGLWDPDAVAAAVAAGEGGTIFRAIGAWNDARHGEPVLGPWRVVRIIPGPSGDAEEALLRGKGVDLTVRTSRMPFAHPDDPAFPPDMFVGPEPIETAAYDAVVVKNGYLFPTQQANAGDHFMALTPGGTDLVIGRLNYSHRRRPLYPWESDADAPNSVEIIHPLHGEMVEAEMSFAPPSP
ncbi:M81 family metallopeptidase [Microbacterium sp. MPKO10]|uniref:M81 family metallopeptidase n=1 Tax=Microbacterium sp. MPKO10 TaxID=2989818 RepID=UPI0022356C09|nr:M81 family metallopeptidase [Microbacterium sp. MPKO10]MCW4457869.1 M81 family metallopeptidase [Microbacterium sp. MPKO10]